MATDPKILYQKITQINTAFYKEISKLASPAFVDSYMCEMACYQNPKANIEESDSCAETCRKQSNPLRSKIQETYKASFSKLSDCSENCGKDVECTKNCIKSYAGSLKAFANTLTNSQIS
ncbi:unnamed protein product [Blepharisma stoltei]|uniref:Uncharacterized protein n=1 Tax=Blepharisma stoltei TaxID=1481888 RepID=A0AAU9J6P4_9CILI|nr:unnamed protein product [Blepharisma stoltei]